MRKTAHITLIVAVAILVILVALKFVSSDSASEPLQSPKDVASSKPALSQERAFSSHRGPKDYDVIAENNLFRPLGWKKEIVRPVKFVRTVDLEPIVERSPPTPPSYTLVLTGIVQNDSGWIAIIEDQKMKEGLFLHRGEMLKDTLVGEILPERIILARSNTIIRLTIGESIEYGTDGQILFDTVTMMKRPQFANEANNSSETGTDKSDNQQSVIERMRARRRQGLGQ